MLNDENNQGTIHVEMVVGNRRSSTREGSRMALYTPACILQCQAIAQGGGLFFVYCLVLVISGYI